MRLASRLTTASRRPIPIRSANFTQLPDQDLAYLPQGTEHFEDYVRAVHWAQDYALANRELMMRNRAHHA